jgi:hypothetical protein
MDKKTAVQELMQWMEDTEFMVNEAFIDKINQCLEKEAEQMVDFFERGCFHPKPIINTQIEGQKLYNQIYGDGK